MSDAASRFARLDSRLIRRGVARLPAPDAFRDEARDIPPPTSEWREDLRLFLFAWAAGFVFFLAFLL